MKSNLKDMTKEEKIELYEALKEKDRRKKLKKNNFVPNSGQIIGIRSNAMARCNTSGNAAGKSTWAIHEAVWQCQGYNPITKEYNLVPTDVVVLLYQNRKSDSIWKLEMLRWFDIDEKQFKKMGTPHTQKIEFPNGSNIIFFSQESDPQAFEGISGYSLVVVDEPCLEWQFNSLFRGARNKGIKPKFLIVGTLIGPNSVWIRKLQQRWAEGLEPDWFFIKTSSYVNKHNLADGFLEKFEARLSASERLVRIEGGASDLEGLALAHLFKRGTHVLPVAEFKPHYDMPCVIGIDPHTSKPNVAVLLGVDRNGLYYCIDEICTKVPAREYAQLLKPWVKQYRILDIVADCSGVSDMSGGEAYKSFIEILNEEGIKDRKSVV